MTVNFESLAKAEKSQAVADHERYQMLLRDLAAGKDRDETDILEMGHSTGIREGTQERYLNGACHWWSGNGYSAASHASHITNPYSLQDGEFHTYTCVWDENYIRMYIDREKYPDVAPYFEMRIVDNMGGTNAFRKSNFLLLNLAVGGNFPGIHDIDDVTALASGSAEMSIDYVRVFQKQQAP